MRIRLRGKAPEESVDAALINALRCVWDALDDDVATGLEVIASSVRFASRCNITAGSDKACCFSVAIAHQTFRIF